MKNNKRAKKKLGAKLDALTVLHGEPNPLYELLSDSFSLEHLKYLYALKVEDIDYNNAVNEVV